MSLPLIPAGFRAKAVQDPSSRMDPAWDRAHVFVFWSFLQLSLCFELPGKISVLLLTTVLQQSSKPPLLGNGSVETRSAPRAD